MPEYGPASGERNTSLVDLGFWAKERGLRGQVYPLVCHSLDAAAAALVLWREYLSPGLRETIASAMEVDEEQAGRCVAFWAGMHDVGKLTREFQEQTDVDLSAYPGEELSGERRSHAAATGQWLPFALPSVGYPDSGPVTWLVAQLLGGHHGRFGGHPDPGSRNPLLGLGFTSSSWEGQRRALLNAVFGAVGRPEPPHMLDGPTAAVVCGLVILADWLVSQEDFLLGRLGALPADGSVPELRAHFRESEQQVPDLLDSAGLRPITVSPAPFTESFPHIDTPNGLQASLAEHLPPLCTGPGLVLVTAPMGEGKTEAAYHVADLLGAATGRPGRFLALPTTATADQMHSRLKAYARHRAEHADPERPSTLALLHSMAWLNPDYAPADAPGVSTVLADADRRDPFAATEWLMGRKRGLLASWSVGTIDQALMAVLRAKHNALRLFGLAGKVVVVDEAHAVDPYMQVLLEQLLRWLGALDVPVVLLSATLHHSIANSLVKAYLEGARGYRWRRSEPQPVPEVSYPGWLHADARTGTVTRSADVDPAPIATTPREPLDLRLVDIPVRDSRPDRTEALRAELAPLVERGGCAAVICTTVAEAQEVYDLLADWFAEWGANAPELHLLHSRFPNRQRTEITEAIVDRFGKDGAREGRRPRSAVLVATQVVEQSLDLDLDLMVTDIAPVSLLLQRAGRCWRHEHLGIIRRPPWARRPELVVLTPEQDAETDGPPRFPRSWQAVYPLSLFQRTHALLRRRDGTPVRIPDDVQRLVDGVYDDDSLAEDLEADLDRMGEELAKRGLARNAVVPDPGGVGSSLLGLSEFDFDVDEHLLATRFGAGSVRVLCHYVDPAGRRWLDPDCAVELPEKGTGRGGRFTVADCRDLVARTVPVRMGLWFDRLAEDNRPPEAWRESFHLRDLVLVPQRVTEEGAVLPTEAGGREWLLDPRKGLVF
ncbi:CRISPR-associated helicase/endonuclease Cas3 [Thermobifida halotolerans]|uniref:CRISPR-associated helicase/endonuclease Cas3 n=1 Tax=Thermobifida halotolerans TaxID=483545 RepID=A0AA97M073_9ACTN|nr:CRISPR-associated helicase/endonuclease Cas3 [Thermobifida halotolerans]UOE21073.1 CRISPR-associated helicase/endonuclease Cas3 [Thermobifida halotolerans]